AEVSRKGCRDRTGQIVRRKSAFGIGYAGNRVVFQCAERKIRIHRNSRALWQCAYAGYRVGRFERQVFQEADERTFFGYAYQIHRRDIIRKRTNNPFSKPPRIFTYDGMYDLRACPSVYALRCESDLPHAQIPTPLPLLRIRHCKTNALPRVFEHESDDKRFRDGASPGRTPKAPSEC